MAEPHTGKGNPRRTDQLRSQNWKLSNGDDIEYALQAAERLLGAAEERRRHEQNKTFAILSAIAGAVLSLAASLYFVPVLLEGYGWASIAAWLSVVVTSLVVAGLLRALWGQRRRASLDHTLKLAVSMSAMLNEAILDVAEREGWSYLRVQTTRLRLSAFPLVDTASESSRRRWG